MALKRKRALSGYGVKVESIFWQRKRGIYRNYRQQSRGEELPRRRAPQSALRVFEVAVTDASASVYRSGLTTAYEREPASTVLTVDGTLDIPVVRMEKVSISVRRRENRGDDVGGALGISSIWQVIVFIPDPEFSDLLTIIVSGQLRRVHLVLESMKRGKGSVTAISFYTRDEEDE